MRSCMYHGYMFQWRGAQPACWVYGCVRECARVVVCLNMALSGGSHISSRQQQAAGSGRQQAAGSRQRAVSSLRTQLLTRQLTDATALLRVPLRAYTCKKRLGGCDSSTDI